ncbi:hypothetical protein B1M20_17850, partial [Salmonella enterica subsp. enterica serovar Dublin]
TQLPHVPHGGAQGAPRACARVRRPPAGRGAVLRVSGRRAAGYGGHRTVTASAPLSCTIHG